MMTSNHGTIAVRHGYARVFAALATLSLSACTSGDGELEEAVARADDGLVVGACGDVLRVASVSASANDGNLPANAVDGNLATRWSALGKGVFLTLDLGAPKPLCSLAIAWYRGDARKATFTISSSPDGAAFTQVFAGTSGGTSAAAETYPLPSNVSGRFLRVTVLGTTESEWASISEVTARTTGSTAPPPASTGLQAPVLDGTSGYVDVGDDDAYSQVTRGGLSVEAWIRPDSLSMPRRESSGYVHWMGKGTAGSHEWTTRMYQQGNSEDRANRISFYHFNPAGGLGAGSYFQDPVRVGEWIHVVGTIDRTTIRIYKNGALRDSDPLSGYDIAPRNTTSSLRIGTRDFNSFFQGSIARVAIYGGTLPATRIQAHAAARGAAYDGAVLSEPTLVGFWRLNETGGTVAVDATGRRNGTYRGGAAVGRTTWSP